MTALGLVAAVAVGLMVGGTLLGAAMATGRFLARRDEARPPVSYLTVDPKCGHVPADVAEKQMETYRNLLPPQTAAARRGDMNSVMRARRVPWAADSPLAHGRPGSPEAVRALLAGIAETLLMEAASASVRGDESNARHLAMLEEGVRDARDAIRD